MKKRIVCLLLSICILVCSAPTAFAQGCQETSEDAAQTAMDNDAPTPEEAAQTAVGSGKTSAVSEELQALYDLVAALPDAADITDENREAGKAQIEEIMSAYDALTAEEQAVFDESKAMKTLLAVNDAAYAAVTQDSEPIMAATYAALTSASQITEKKDCSWTMIIHIILSSNRAFPTVGISTTQTGGASISHTLTTAEASPTGSKDYSYGFIGNLYDYGNVLMTYSKPYGFNTSFITLTLVLNSTISGAVTIMTSDEFSSLNVPKYNASTSKPMYTQAAAYAFLSMSGSTIGTGSALTPTLNVADQHGVRIDDASVSYSLVSACAGVSVNSSTGAVTIGSGAVQGSTFQVQASATRGGWTATATSQTITVNPIQYTVSFNGNGATGGSTANQTFTYGTAQSLRANGFTRTGLTVNYNANGGTVSSASAVANYTFNGWEDRGSILYSGTTYAYTTFDAPYYVKTYGDLYNAFGNDKYALISHYVNNGKGEGRAAKGSTPALWVNGESVKNLSTVNGYTAPLYANWTLSSVTLPTPTRTGYTFAGWYTAASGGTRVGGGGDRYTPSAGITLYAQWAANSYVITFNYNDSGQTTYSTPSTGDSPKVTTGSSNYYEVIWLYPARTGYTFTGWYTAASGGELVYAANGYGVAGGSYWDANSLWKYPGNLTVYAHWTANTYTVTLHTNGGTINSGNVTGYTYGIGATLPTNVTQSDRLFDGWYETSDFSGTAVTGISTTATGNKTYYAKWKNTSSYTVNIPQTVNLTTDNFQLSATCTGFSSGDTLNICVSSNNSWNLKSDALELPYGLSKTAGGAALTNGSTAASFTSSGSQNLYYTVNTPAYSGTYTDTLTFTVTLNGS